mgnify:CR=1 FL=1
MFYEIKANLKPKEVKALSEAGVCWIQPGIENLDTRVLKLMKKGVLYAPDYAINAGGLINVSNELEGYNQDKAYSQAEGIHDTLMEIFRRSDEENISTNEASDRQAEDRIKKIGNLKSFYLPQKKSFKIRSV